MAIRPLYDRVLIKRLDEGEQVRGGIIIPDTAKEKPQQGEVKAVGSGKKSLHEQFQREGGGCKSAASWLRRFESFLPHHASP